MPGLRASPPVSHGVADACIGGMPAPDRASSPGAPDRSVWRPGGRRSRSGTVLALGFALTLTPVAAEAQSPEQDSTRSSPSAPSRPPLPEPLTLEFALSIAGEDHPAVVGREAALARSRAMLDAAVARDAPGAAKEAARADVESERWRLADARHAQHVAVLRGYFDALLADLVYARENEAMAIAFITADRARERNALGQVSDVEALALESAYQRVRHSRFAAAARQRASRARLASLMNRPGELSSRLVSPPLTVFGRTIPDHAALEAEVVRGNPSIKAARARVDAAMRRVEEARAGDRPLLSGELEAGVGTRPTGNGWRDAEVAQREADLTAAKATLRSVELEVRQALLESWLALGTLAAERDSTEAFAVYRDYHLDRSRALYEHEARADLGDAMVQISESTLRSARVGFELALAWARIHGLAGRDPETLGEWLSGNGGQ